MSEERVKVITRFKTMSGKRGGRTLLLTPDEAKAMIARGWADPAPSERPTKSGRKEGLEL